MMRYALLCAATAAVAVASPAYAQPANEVEQYNFKVSGGRLSSVVAEIAAQARASITVDRGAETDVTIEGISGTYTLKDALDIALSNTDYQIDPGPNNTFRIVRRGSDADIVVTARRRDFARTESSLLTRTDTPLRQTPGTIDSVTEEVLRSQNAISVNEALRNIPGVTFNTSNGRTEVFIGQDGTGGTTYLNGLRTAGIASNPPITDIEAIEVLKGPAAILTGSALSGGAIAGGVVNFVPKRATGREGADIAIGFGSGNEILGSADVGGAISRDHGLFWRLAVLGEYADTLPGGGNRPTQKVINPMFGYRGSGIRFDASFQYYTKFTPFPLSAAFIPGTGMVDYSANRVSPDSGLQVESKRGSYNLEIDLVDKPGFSLTLRNRGLYQYAERAGQYQLPLVYDFFGSTFLLNLSTFDRTKQLSEYLDLYAKFSTGPLEHQMIVAGDLMHSNSYTNTSQGIGFSSDTTPVSLNPISYAPSGLATVRQYGLILQDQINWGRFHALLGLRQTWFRQNPYRFSGGQFQPVISGGKILFSENNKLLLNGGLVFDVTKAVSIYFAYSNTFSPYDSSYTTVSGDILPPMTRTQYEIGAKMGLFGDRMTVNVSAYKYSTDNAIEQVGSFYRAIGGIKGKGAQISISGSVTPTLKILAGYAYSTGYPVTDPNRPLIAKPEHVANLWAIQTFKLGGKQSIDVGLGGNYNSGFYTQDLNVVLPPLPIYHIDNALLSVNGSLTYTIGQFSVNAVVNNIFDRRNYQPSSSVVQIPIEAGRSFRINFRARI